MKTLHFPAHTGLSPRPFDAYDALCERYYYAFSSSDGRSYAVRRECERELQSRFGSDDFDMDSSHGRSIVKRYKVTTI